MRERETSQTLLRSRKRLAQPRRRRSTYSKKNLADVMRARKFLSPAAAPARGLSPLVEVFTCLVYAHTRTMNRAVSPVFSANL